MPLWTIRDNKYKSHHASAAGDPGTAQEATHKEYAKKEPGPEAAFDDGLP